MLGVACSLVILVSHGVYLEKATAYVGVAYWEGIT